jgi:hypothetical protein
VAVLCLPELPNQTLAGLTGLIYSGDHDMAVPHTGSEAWTSWMGKQLGVERAWGPWHTADHQASAHLSCRQSVVAAGLCPASWVEADECHIVLCLS